jgi:hypothetical protein
MILFCTEVSITNTEGVSVSNLYQFPNMRENIIFRNFIKDFCEENNIKVIVKSVSFNSETDIDAAKTLFKRVVLRAHGIKNYYSDDLDVIDKEINDLKILIKLNK